MNFQFLGKVLKDGEKVVLGEEVSDVLTNVALANPKGKAVVKMDGKMVLCLSPEHPHAMFRGKGIIDSPTTVSVEGSEVHLTGYSASFEIIEDDEEEEEEEVQESCCATKNSCCPSSKPAAKAKEPVAEVKKATKPAKKSSTRKSSLASEPSIPIQQVAPVPNKVYPDRDLANPLAEPIDQEVDAGILELKVDGKMKQFFINWRDFSCYSGDPEDAEFEGWFHPDKKIIHKTEAPTHKVPELQQRIQQASDFAKRKAEQAREDWEKDHDDASDVTIDSGEEEVFEEKSSFLKKRKVEAEKMTSRTRGMQLS